MTPPLHNGWAIMRRCNIVLIVLDALRATNLSCYGYTRPTTPHLDQFAQASMVYENAFATSSWSLPTHASLFTGLMPTQHGADDDHKFLEPAHTTLAEFLSARNYLTAAFCYNPYVSHATGLDRGFQWFNPATRSRLGYAFARARHYAAKLQCIGDAGARLVNRQVRAALREFAAHARPFFLFAHYAECHTPYRYPRAYQPTRAARVNQNPWRQLANPALMNAADFEILTALYDGALNYLDAQVAQVITWLRDLQLLNETMVIVTADHGENLGEHGIIGHQYCLYDTLVHVPLIVHYPNGTTTPARNKQLVSTIELAPTILEMLGENPSALGDLKGSSLLAAIPREAVFAEMSKPDLSPYLKQFPNADTRRHDRALRMIRTTRHKLIWGSDDAHELYNLQNDPNETNNLIRTRPELFAVLATRLESWHAKLTRAQHDHAAPEFERQVVTRLRALGYLE